MKFLRAVAVWTFVLSSALLFAQSTDYHNPDQGDFVVKDFQFKSGERLPEVRLHYYTLGKLQKDSTGRARNAVIVLHGTGGSGRQFVTDNFGGVLFGPGQLLDASKYFIILPDNVGHGK